ncbi:MULTISPECIES: hypothetical protein [Mammaliicoccus]|uniref:Uncharacterized protein n=1 Tax=Mammaliicoccus sciuri TaxID=1296 RepID=A0AB37HL51_MAMSC|nr:MULTISPECIES: hypothetical protein [Mammaliicoccus]ARB39862.1 hypothetical protein B5728_02850 [Mammaliicoccus sciuri]MEB7466027.1 hypothetical protein [Mammaliicoccus sciuri]QQC95204.1 hypothetical protein JCQ35_12455 [Mammaliicoccus sciuri]QRN91550.1 hypothetical protein JRU67_01620 [Mammaliicoccus sciuri]RIO74867.1 hypothetical protein BUZ85_01335 [Mammaliicoccus sciuri]
MIETVKKIARILFVVFSGLLVARYVIQQLNQFTDLQLSWFYLEHVPYSFIIIVILYFICIVVYSSLRTYEQRD